METYEAGGLEVPVETWGSTGETLVFLPGLGCPPAEYRAGIRSLAETHRVIVPDLSFRSGLRLPATIDDYRALVSTVCEPLAPGAPWAGHSFGGLLALTRDGPAIACAPSVPARTAFWRTFGRAARMQVREYLGFEGKGAWPYAPRILRDYALTAATRPRSIFNVTNALNADPASQPITSSRAIVFLSRKDDLYRSEEYAEYFAAQGESPDIRLVSEGHDWTITHPRLFAERLAAAVAELVAA